MANPPHGGILKVSHFDLEYNRMSLMYSCQDLVARDAPIRNELKAEAETLADLVLTEVRSAQS